MPELSLFTGISTVFGLIGAILFVILKTQNSSNKSILTPELINALKNTNINSADLKGLSPQKIKLILETQTDISKDLITNISKEVNSKVLVLKVTMFSSFGLAILFFLISQFSVTNTDSNEINILDTATVIKDTAKIDSSKNRTNNTPNENILKPKRTLIEQTDFRLKGIIVDTEGEPIEKAIVKLISMNNTIALETDDKGYFDTIIKSNKDKITYKIHVTRDTLQKKTSRTFINNKTASQIIIEKL